MCAICIVPDMFQQNSELPKVRYTVDYGMLDGETKRYYIILDDGILTFRTTDMSKSELRQELFRLRKRNKELEAVVEQLKQIQLPKEKK